ASFVVSHQRTRNDSVTSFKRLQMPFWSRRYSYDFGGVPTFVESDCHFVGESPHPTESIDFIDQQNNPLEALLRNQLTLQTVSTIVSALFPGSRPANLSLKAERTSVRLSCPSTSFRSSLVSFSCVIASGPGACVWRSKEVPVALWV